MEVDFGCLCMGDGGGIYGICGDGLGVEGCVGVVIGRRNMWRVVFRGFKPLSCFASSMLWSRNMYTNAHFWKRGIGNMSLSQWLKRLSSLTSEDTSLTTRSNDSVDSRCLRRGKTMFRYNFMVYVRVSYI